MCEVSFLRKKYKPLQKITKKMSFQKKTAIKAIVSFVLLIYCAVVANVNYLPEHKIFLHKTVNITWGKEEFKNMMQQVKNACKYTLSAGGKYFDIMVSVFDGSFDNEVVGTSAMANINREPAIYPKAPEMQQTQTDTQQSAPQSKPQFRYPAEGKITSEFGSREHPLNGNSSVHYGIDIAANEGDCVISSLPGTVTATGFDANLGNYVKVKHSENMETVYGHLSEILVHKDEVVDSNTRIGSAGSTGAATGPHVHLEVRIDGVCQDPRLYLPKK